VSGTALVTCVITLSGSLTNCRILKGLPYMDAAILAALSQWQYEPLLWKGRAVSVQYVIPIKIEPPPPRPSPPVAPAH
jgi:protein TonB